MKFFKVNLFLIFFLIKLISAFPINSDEYNNENQVEQFESDSLENSIEEDYFIRTKRAVKTNDTENASNNENDMDSESSTDDNEAETTTEENSVSEKNPSRRANVEEDEYDTDISTTDATTTEEAVTETTTITDEELNSDDDKQTLSPLEEVAGRRSNLQEAAEGNDQEPNEEQNVPADYEAQDVADYMDDVTKTGGSQEFDPFQEQTLLVLEYGVIKYIPEDNSPRQYVQNGEDADDNEETWKLMDNPEQNADEFYQDENVEKIEGNLENFDDQGQTFDTDEQIGEVSEEVSIADENYDMVNVASSQDANQGADIIENGDGKNDFEWQSNERSSVNYPNPNYPDENGDYPNPNFPAENERNSDNYPNPNYPDENEKSSVDYPNPNFTMTKEGDDKKIDYDADNESNANNGEINSAKDLGQFGYKNNEQP